MLPTHPEMKLWQETHVWSAMQEKSHEEKNSTTFTIQIISISKQQMKYCCEPFLETRNL